MQRTWALIMLAVVCAAVQSRAAEVVTQPFQGVTIIHRTETSPRPLDIHVALIDMLAPGIRFQATPESPHADGLTVAQTTRKFVTDVGAQLAINGDFYASAGSPGGLPHRDVSSFAASDGNVYSAFGGIETAMNIGKNNVAHAIVASSQTPAGRLQPNPNVSVWNAVGGYGYLVNNGSLPTYWNDPGDHRYAFANALHPRTAIGVNADRTRIALFVVDGRQTHSGGMNFPEMADMLRNDYGMHWAINLDGGGSTTMVTADPTPRVLNQPSDGPERPVGNSLAVFARPSPPEIPKESIAANLREETGIYLHAGAAIRSAAPTENVGDAGAIRVGYDTEQGKTRGVFSFDLIGIAPGATIHSVALTLDAFDTNGATGNRYVDLELFELDADVVEDQITWDQSKSGSAWLTPGGDYRTPSLSSLFAQQAIGLKTFVSTVDFVAAAQAAFDAGESLNLLVAALDAETLGEATSSNINLRVRSDDATTGLRPTLTIHYTAEPPLAGDFNLDGIVDAADYVAWRDGLGSRYTPDHYDLWKANFGAGTGGGQAKAVVPEPGACWLIAIGGSATLASRRHCRDRGGIRQMRVCRLMHFANCRRRSHEATFENGRHIGRCR